MKLVPLNRIEMGVFAGKGDDDKPRYRTEVYEPEVRDFDSGAVVRPARVFEVEDGEQAKRLIQLGAAREATSADLEEAEGEAEGGDNEDTGEDLNELTVAELQERAKSAGVDVEGLKGTGQGGRVLKADLIKAIEAAEEEGSQAGSGAQDTQSESSVPQNPSAVS